jgi:hypothetical protein
MAGLGERRRSSAGPSSPPARWEGDPLWLELVGEEIRRRKEEIRRGRRVAQGVRSVGGGAREPVRLEWRASGSSSRGQVVDMEEEGAALAPVLLCSPCSPEGGASWRDELAP